VNVLNPGDIKINYVRIYNKTGEFVDVSRMFVNITLYEDIMSAFKSGSILLTDSLSLNSMLPFVGEEILDISFETPMHEGDAFKYTGKFHIYKISAIENFKTKNAIIELQLISIDGFVDMNTKLSQTFRGEPSVLVTKLLKTAQGLNTQAQTIIEKTASNIAYTSNYWTPSQNIFYIAGESYNDYSNPNFLFFENKDGFTFVSLDTLYAQQSVIEFIRDEKNREQTIDGHSVPNTEDQYARILDMSTKTMYDYIDRLQTGMYGSATYTYDVETKKLRFLQRNAAYDFKSNKLNDVSGNELGLTFLPTAKLFTDIGHKSLYSNTVAQPFDKKIRRSALLKRADSFKTNIKVFGRANYKVGDIVSLKVYANKEVSEKTPDGELIDPLMSGRYLISALSHEISSEAHFCNMELIRDSYQKV
jgi:hypothetical protein